MRILAVTNMYPSETAPGRGVFVHEQIKGLRAIGVSVRVLFIDRRSQGASAYYRMGPKLTREFSEFNPDLVHIMYGGVMAHQIVSRYHLRPTLITFHGSDLLGENLSGWLRKIISHYGVWCSRRAATKADGIILVARHLLNALPRSLNPAKIRVLPCGIDLELFRPMDPASCRKQLGWNSDSFHVLFASSNADPVKRPWLAKSAIDQARQRGVPAELHCMSGVPYSEVPLWLNASDALLLTSLHEGSPTIIKEALACGLPIVSVDVGDVSERLEGIAGCHVTTPLPSDLADKLSVLYQNRTRLSCQHRLESLSILTIARRLQAFYSEIAGQGNVSVPEPQSPPLLQQAHS
jgi:teichuronic acid biosynthesis glycosyltransferase TuaC